MKREPGCFSSFSERAEYQSEALPNFWVSFLVLVIALTFSRLAQVLRSAALRSYSNIAVQTFYGHTYFCFQR